MLRAILSCFLVLAVWAPAVAQIQHEHADLRIRGLNVLYNPSTGEFTAPWNRTIHVQQGAAPVPVRELIWLKDESGNLTTLVSDRFLGYWGPSDATSAYNCPNVDYCNQLATDCRNPSAGHCSVSISCPGGTEIAVNGTCRTKDYGPGQGDCSNLICMCEVDAPNCPPVTGGGGPPEFTLDPWSNYFLTLDICGADQPVDTETGRCEPEEQPCAVCDHDTANNGGSS